MKNKIQLALVTALALGSTSAFATNGDNMIGQGAKSRAMGGVGIATSFGAESGLANPAMINSVKNREIMGAVTVFSPNVSFSSNAMANAMGADMGGAYPNSATVPSADSDASMNIIPEVSYAARVNDSLVYGVSITGTSGMGVDYDGASNGAASMTTALQILKVAVPVAYSVGGLTIAAAPILQYGSLEINYATMQGASSNPTSSDTSYGYELGAAYQTGGVTIGAVFKSKIDMEYKDNIASAMTAFGVQSITSGDKLSQPSELGVGLSFTEGASTIAIDIKNVAWSEAAGYKEFGWEDQTVVAMGYQYATKGWALRVGYNQGKSPIAAKDASSMMADGGNGYDNGAVNFFNLAGFPGIVDQHITFGGSYQLTSALGLDAAVVYAPEVSESFDTTGMTQGMVYQGAIDQDAPAANAMAAANAAQSSTADVTHSQMGMTVALTYKF